MSKTRTVGTLQLSTDITLFADSCAIDMKIVPGVEHQRALVNSTLAAFGNYRISRYLRPNNGALDVDILEDDSSEKSTFDIDKFYDFARGINHLCNKFLNKSMNDTEAVIQLHEFSESNNVNETLVRDLVESLIRRSRTATIIDGEGDEIELGISQSGTKSPPDSMDINVASMKNFVHVETNKGSYIINSALPEGIKRGDKIQVLDIGPEDNRKCISAGAASSIVDPAQPELFN